MQLNSVVLPDPLGPIRPQISPRPTSNDTPFSAITPPKRSMTLRTLSRGDDAAAGIRRARQAAAGGSTPGLHAIPYVSPVRQSVSGSFGGGAPWPRHAVQVSAARKAGQIVPAFRSPRCRYELAPSITGPNRTQVLPSQRSICSALIGW